MISLPKWAQPPVRYQICAVTPRRAPTRPAPQAFIKQGRGHGRPRRAEGLRLRTAAAQVRRRAGRFTALLALCTGITLAFLAIPIVALFTRGAARATSRACCGDAGGAATRSQVTIAHEPRSPTR